MEGIFLRKKNSFWLSILFLCGLCFIGLYIFLNIVDSEATSELLIFLIVGILICLAVIPSWLLNLGAFIHIDDDSIKAKYHWFGKIDCKLSDVSFAVAQMNTLIIQLKDGKTHTIMGIENAFPLSSAIRRNMSFSVVAQPETLIANLKNLKSAKRKGLIYVCSGIVLMFVIIFLAVFLTGGRELHEFDKTDWMILAIMGVLEIVTYIYTFYFAKKTGKHNIPIEKLQYEIQRRIIETQPLLPGNIIKVFADENYTGRITLFKTPNEDTVYYSVQEFVANYDFIKVYDSEIFENIGHLPGGFHTLIDITDKVLH